MGQRTSLHAAFEVPPAHRSRLFQIGDANAVSFSFGAPCTACSNLTSAFFLQSIPTVQPVISRPMWGSYPEAAALNSILFVSGLSIASGMNSC